MMKTRIFNLFVLIVSLALMSSAAGALAQRPSLTLPGEGEQVAPQQQAHNVVLEGQIGGATSGVAVQGQYAYIGVGPRLVILDISNLAHPVFVGQTDVFPGFVQDVAVVGSYAYVAIFVGGLHIIDVSDPAAPFEVGVSAAGWNPQSVVVEGDYAYVVDLFTGLYIIDVSDSAAPFEAGFYDTPGSPCGVAVAGSFAYVGDGDSGLRIIDVSDAAAPTEAGFYDTPGDARGVAVAGSYAYVADNASGLRIIDVSTPAAPFEAGFYDTPGNARDVAVAGSYAYVADEWDGLRIIDASDPATAFEAGFYDTQGNAGHVAVVGSYTFVGDWENGLRIISVANPATPSEVGFYDTPVSASGVAVTGNYAYVTAWNRGLRAIDISDPAAPFEAGFSETPGSARGVALAGSYAYVADGGSGLRIIDISDPAALFEAGFYDTPGDARGVAVAGSYAYLADGGAGLRIIAISNPVTAFEAGFYNTPGNAYGVAVAGSYVYVAAGESGLRIIDVSNPTAPTEAGFYDTPGVAYGVAVAGNYAYVADESTGLRIIDVSDPAAPFEAGFYDMHHRYAYGVAVVGSYAYVAYEYSGLRIVDVSDPAGPFEAGSYDTPASAMGVAVVGSRAYVADYDSLLILRFVLSYTDCPVRINDDPTEYTTVQAAVDAASTGDVVKVAGTCTGVGGRAGLTQHVYLDKSLTVRGGYTTTNWITPDPEANPTTLDALGYGRVFYITGAVSPTIEGLRITGGDATGLGGVPWGWDAGGGVYVISATVTINNNRIFNNYSPYLGGGVYLWDSTSTLNGNAVTSNNAGYGGGALFWQSNVTLNGNTIATNTSTTQGGGIAAWGNALTLNSNIIRANITGGDGGGLGGGGNIVLVNTIVADNQANRGGGLYIDGSASLLHNTIVGNTSNDGSGIYVNAAHSTVALTNTILAQSSVGISVTAGSTVTVNGILWYATPITISQALTATVEIQNQSTGDPLFDADGYHLRIGSPAIDVGVLEALTRDVDGDSRPYGLGFDIGADEVPYVEVPPETGATLVYTNTEGSTTTLVVPSDAVSETMTIVLTQLDPATTPTSPTLAAGGIALELDAYLGNERVEDFSFNTPVTLTFEYTDADVAGMDESTLRLYRYVCSGPETFLLCVWEIIGTRPGEGQSLDATNNVLTAWLTGFSRFGTMGTELPPTFEVSKTYTSNRVAGTPVTYTLTVINTGGAGATAVSLEDVVPEYLTWSSGGTLELNRVRWTFDAITANGGTAIGGFHAILPCTTSLEIVNDDYRVVSSAQGVTSTVGPPVSFTIISPTLTVGITHTPLAPAVGDTVTFTATATTNGTPLSYAWSFGGTGLYTEHTFAEAGPYTVTLTATDTCGYARVATVNFAVRLAGYTVYLPLVMRE